MSRADGLRWPVRPPPLLMPAKEAAVALRPGEAAAAAAISESLGAKGSRENAAAADFLVGHANGLSGRLCSALQGRETTQRVKKESLPTDQLVKCCFSA